MKPVVGPDLEVTLASFEPIDGRRCSSRCFVELEPTIFVLEHIFRVQRLTTLGIVIMFLLDQ